MTRYLLRLLLVVVFAACSPTVVSTSLPVPSITATPPPAKALTLGAWHDLIYHEQVGQVILINGGPETGKAPGEPLELWSWDGQTWSLLSADPDGPSWRNFASVAYDSNRGVLVLYGGLQSESETFEDTWEWDGQTWKQHAATGPGPREAAGIAYDSGRGRVVLFGGAQSGEMMNDTWQWDGSEWIQVSTDGPSARFPAAFVYDAANQNVVLFGGHAFGAQGIRTYGDTWTWDGASWTEITSEGPSPRDGADGAFNQDSNRVFLFGGAEIGSDVTLLDDTWTWDGNRWSQIHTAGPPPRVHPALAFHPGRGKVVLTGGSNAPSTVLSDTWEWDGQAWVCILDCH